ncbi:MAG: UPF0147 family protein [Candidatus Woesearchaeota archaeon]|jgi:uncharacterized protein (UPF0147 family)
MDNLKSALDILQEMQQDNSVSKNVRSKVSLIYKELESCPKEELSLKVNKILSELEELSSDMNLPMFVRTQIWSLTGILESLC